VSITWSARAKLNRLTPDSPLFVCPEDENSLTKTLSRFTRQPTFSAAEIASSFDSQFTIDA
jgi:hypothetical protein